MDVVELSTETDWPGFRLAARQLLARGVRPEGIVWRTLTSAEPDLFAASPETGFELDAAPRALHALGVDESQSTSPASGQSQRMPTAAVMVPRALLELCETVILHANPSRFALIYRFLFRLRQLPALKDDPIDPDRLRLEQMAHAVRRDKHKMRAFVRFRPIPREGLPALHVAWFEPEHHIVASNASFFVKRFAQMHWAILTPLCCARWDGTTLDIGPGADRDEAPTADAGERLWLTYYAHIFNPARLKLDMMRKEMPRKYWHNLPEAHLIGQLAASAMQRSGEMVDAPASVPSRRVVPLTPRERMPIRNDIPAFSDVPEDPDAAMAFLNGRSQQCRRCPIGQHATQAVWGEGPATARLMVVGEQPGDIEDLKGRPFVGPAGQLFDQALAALDWPREGLYLTNAVKHFKFEPRGKRRMHKTASQQEAAACLDWLEREINIVKPRAVLALGATAARALMGRPVAVTRERGTWMKNAAGLDILVTWHPSALLRMDDGARAGAYDQWLQDLALARAAVQGAA